ncbi:hypothetical protein HID58_051187 [Brassica napus]|uniref:Uncharacterized protein n=1 Tax=Brassica napus TaxID=3708 RepID=A0ABQ8A938_BRANA|nr:hypothetical protein HID58_051187 [Brassica napus]
MKHMKVVCHYIDHKQATRCQLLLSCILIVMDGSIELRGCTCTLTLPPSFDVGDERGAAEGFGYDGSVLDEDVVAVVSDDEDSAVGNWMGRHDGGLGQRIMEKGELKKKVMKVERRGRDKSFIQTETCIKHALTKLPRAGIRFKVEMNARTALRDYMIPTTEENQERIPPMKLLGSGQLPVNSACEKSNPGFCNNR